MGNTISTVPLDCACVIHGTAYSWDYVDRLHNMLTRHCSRPIRLHVYTEESRAVPSHLVKHVLTPWSVHKGWWYKIQMFNPAHHAGPLLYFDLDVVITNSIDWVWQHSTSYFWGVRDFRYLQQPTHTSINSSVMWWDTVKYQHVWGNFKSTDTRLHRGDQDYIMQAIAPTDRKFFDSTHFQSYRWQVLDGGYNFQTRQHTAPGTGATIAPESSVVVFHGNPKPAQIHDVVIKQHWK